MSESTAECRQTVLFVKYLLHSFHSYTIHIEDTSVESYMHQFKVIIFITTKNMAFKGVICFRFLYKNILGKNG